MSASASAQDNLCNICYDTFSAKVRKPVTCPKCNYSSCVKCVKIYMLNSIEDPHCPNCRYGWTRQFVLQNITKTFLDHEWATHRRQILWQREQAYLPDSQLHAERVLQSRRMAEELIPLQEQYKEWSIQLQSLNNIISEKTSIMNTLSYQKVPYELLQTTDPYEKLLIQDKRTFTHHCPTPNCRGYLDAEFRCGLCKTVSSQNLPSSKCTSCNSIVYKDDYTTFCLNCKTAFNWNTGKSSATVKNTYIHAYDLKGISLHIFYNYKKTFSHIDKIMTALQNYRYRFESTVEHLEAGYIYSCINACINDAIKMYLPPTPPRLKYLLHEIDEKTMMEAINIQHNDYCYEINQIFRAFVFIAFSIFDRYDKAVIAAINSDDSLATFRGTDDVYINEQVWRKDKKTAFKIHKLWVNTWNNFYREFVALRDYCNTQFRNTGVLFDEIYGTINRFPYIDNLFEIGYCTASQTKISYEKKSLTRKGVRIRTAEARLVSAKVAPDQE